MKSLFLSGGLGNQMFQYAFYLSCKKKNIPIMLNLDLYESYRMHNGYMLGNAFGVECNVIQNSTTWSVFFTRLLHRLHPWGLVYYDKPMVFDEKAFVTNAKYIDGCFINHKYFEGLQDEVRKSFRFYGIDGLNQGLSKKLSECNSVAIHIRRGDYLQNPIYRVCDEKYYISAVKKIIDKVESPRFFVFSDDIEWSDGFMCTLGVNYHIISHNTGLDSYKDMYLMTECKHIIIANSTFSWWGAWLNNNPDKIVIAPNKWTTSIPMDKPQDCWNLIEV